MKNGLLKTCSQVAVVMIIVFTLIISGLYVVSVNDSLKSINVELTESTQKLYRLNLELNSTNQQLNDKLDYTSKQLETKISVVDDLTNDKIDLMNEIVEVKSKINDTEILISKLENQSAIDKINEQIKKPSYDYLKNITVFIQGMNVKQEYAWVGTGIIVKETADFTYVLTNNHVSKGCESGNKCSVREDGVNYNIEVVKRSKNNDMALIRVTGKIEGKEVVKGFNNVHNQDRVFLVGHNLGRPFFYSEGTVSGFDVNMEADLVVGLPAGPGNSGSGVVNKDGELVGLLYAVNIVGQFPYQTLDIAHALCVNGEHIQDFLKGLI